MIGAMRVFPSFRAIACVVARRITLCLPVARYGPFCSTPPVPTRTVSLPALRASRTSIQVISSMNSVGWAAMGLGPFGSGVIGSGFLSWTAAATRTKASAGIVSLIGILLPIVRRRHGVQFPPHGREILGSGEVHHRVQLRRESHPRRAQ